MRVCIFTSVVDENIQGPLALTELSNKTVNLRELLHICRESNGFSGPKFIEFGSRSLAILCRARADVHLCSILHEAGGNLRCKRALRAQTRTRAKCGVNAPSFQYLGFHP